MERGKLDLHHSTQTPPKTEATPTQSHKTTPTPDGNGGAERAGTPTQEGQYMYRKVVSSFLLSAEGTKAMN